MRTEIFYSYEAFKKRLDKRINGVDAKYFLPKEMSIIEYIVTGL